MYECGTFVREHEGRKEGKRRMNNEGEAVIALSGLQQMRGERTDGAGEQMQPISLSWRQLEVHLEGDGLLFLQLVTGCNHTPAGRVAFQTGRG